MQELVIARAGDRLLGLASSEVAEIFAPRSVTALPEPFPYLAGAIFRMGRLITVVSTYSLISGGKPDVSARALLARLSAPRENIALSLDCVDAMTPYNELDLKENGSGPLWAGLYPWGEQWVSVLNVAAACALLNSAVAEGQAWGRPRAPITRLTKETGG
ncbi:MAG: chemotaxis protein CheW [Acidobacteria bacterium]|jgi:chemotaxis signal transduction protein|nr:chemotaxis protein CheW [Acidobacteriota bacterium]